MANERTFADLDTLDRFVVYSSSRLLNQFIALDAKIQHFGSRNTEVNKLFHNIVDDISCGLCDGIFAIRFEIEVIAIEYTPCIS